MQVSICRACLRLLGEVPAGLSHSYRFRAERLLNVTYDRLGKLVSPRLAAGLDRHRSSLQLERWVCLDVRQAKVPVREVPSLPHPELTRT